MIYGYARVSTSEQETTLQLDALIRAGADKIYQEKTSSVGKRPVLRDLLSTITKDDQLFVYKLDRLARSLRDLLNIIEQLEQIGCGFKSLTEPIDTTNPAGRLMLNILGSVAEFERSLIRQRSMAGQAAARLRGVHCGRTRLFSADQERAIVDRYRAGGVTLQRLAIENNVDISAIKRAVYRVTKPGHSSLK